MRQAKAGFTIVELLITIVIISLLATISFLSFTKIQSDTRDQQRKSNATIIADALEKYYEKNGEYPSVATVTNTNISQVKSTLGIADTSVLIMPKAAAGTTNSVIPATSPPAADKLVYDASSANQTENTSCKSAPVANAAGCDEFKLKWANEDNSVNEIKSQRSGRPVVLTPPKNPIMTAALVGNSVVGTVTHETAGGGGPCESGTVNYKIITSTNAISTPNWATVQWQTSNTRSISSPVAGTQYFFYAIARCSSDVASEAVNDNVASDDFVYTTVSMNAVWSGSNAIATLSSASGVVCSGSLVAKYLLEYKIDTTAAEGTWQTGQNWTTSPSYTIANASTSNPRKFSFRGQARCDNGSTQGSPSAMSNTDVLISAPPAPSLSRSGPTNATLTWTWPTISCPKLTNVLYTGTWEGNFQQKPPINTIVSGQPLAGVYDDGMSYGLGVVASCGPITSKVLSSAKSVSTRDAVWPYLQAGRGKLYTEYSSGNYAQGRTRLQSSSVESPTGTTPVCSGASYRALTVNFGRDKTGSDDSGWANYYSGSWTGGDIIVAGPANLISRNSGPNTDRNTNLEVQTEVYCHNIYLGRNPTTRLVDRYGILRVWGNTDSNPKPSRYYITCTGQSTYVNSVQQGNRAAGHCAGGEGGSGPETLNGQGNAWQQTW